MSPFCHKLGKIGIIIFLINLKSFVLAPNGAWNVLTRAIDTEFASST